MLDVKDKIIISAVKADLVPLVWPAVVDHIKSATDHSNGELTPQVMFDRLTAEEAVLITVSEEHNILASLVIEKRDFETGKSILNVTLAGGTRIEDWLEDFDKVLDDLAIDYECDDIYLVGRRGWVKKLKDFNYKPVHTVMARKVGARNGWF